MYQVEGNQTYVKAGDNITMDCSAVDTQYRTTMWLYNGGECVTTDGVSCTQHHGCDDVTLRGCSVSEDRFRITVQMRVMDDAVSVWTCRGLLDGQESNTYIHKYGKHIAE